jgi:hypothetical protein
MSLEYEVGPILGLGRKTEAEMEESVRGGTLPASALIELVRHISGAVRGPATTAIATRIVSRAQNLLGSAPLDMTAQSTVGARRAAALLGRIDHGIVV